MGDIRKKHKKFSRPRRAFDIKRITEENEISKRYGLKNKREIWKAEWEIKKIRDNAKKLITANEEDKEAFIKRLQKKGLKVKTIGDVLSLNKEDWLGRRLQTVLVDKNLAKSAKEARQLIVHKHVLVNDTKVNIPSYIVEADEEDKIKVMRKFNQETKKQAEVKEVKDGN
jgi:small subunit ribosomal protein S4